MNDILDRGDHGVGSLVEDLRVLVGRSMPVASMMRPMSSTAARPNSQLMYRTSHVPRVESHHAVPAREALDDAVPVLDGAKTTAEQEERRRAARSVDCVELRIRGRDHQLSGHGGRPVRGALNGDHPEVPARRQCMRRSPTRQLRGERPKRSSSAVSGCAAPDASVGRIAQYRNLFAPCGHGG